MNKFAKTIYTLGGLSLAASSWATYRLTRKGLTTSVDAAFFYSPYELGLPYENVRFYSPDGVGLVGWWLDRPSTNRVIILCPGYGRSKSDLLGVGSRLRQDGYNVLLFDFRDQGESDRTIASIGYFEQDDLESALDYVLWRKPGAQVGLLGYSMGAATGIMVAAKRPEIRVMVADSAFADLRQVLRNIFKAATHLPATPSMELTEWLIWLKAGYRFSHVRPIDFVAKLAPRPILIIHGENDDIAPKADALAFYQAAGEPKELWLTPETAHCGTYFLDRAVYVERVITFFHKWLGEPEREGRSHLEAEARDEQIAVAT